LALFLNIPDPGFDSDRGGLNDVGHTTEAIVGVEPTEKDLLYPTGSIRTSSVMHPPGLITLFDD
jgi:hypothetical protein